MNLAPFESSIAERYHEETKYSEEGLRREAAGRPQLQWSRQPVPFRHVEGERLLLPAEGLPIRRPGEEPADFERRDAGRVDAYRLARLLWFTNGCTRIVRMAGGVHHFRAAPSAGAMYPTEVYVAVNDVPGIEPGVHSYQVLDHSLVAVRRGAPLDALRAATFRHPAADRVDVAVILSGVWFRSSWRYRERGYRRVLLDTGHVLGNLVAAAPEEGLHAVPLASFRARLIEHIVAVYPVQDGPLVVVPLVDSARAGTLPRVPLRRSETVEWRQALARVGDRLPQDAPERIIAALHLAGRLDDQAATISAEAPVPAAAPGSALEIPITTGPSAWAADDPVTATIAVRRSTRRFRPQPIAQDALLRALVHGADAPPGTLLAPELLRTYVVSLDVMGLPPGSYLFDAGGPALAELCRRDLSAEMLHLGLGQEILVHAGAVVVHTVDLTRAVGRCGDRVYRLLGLDAGHVGERLNLAALHEGLGVSGCGGYYDDEMNRALGIPESQAVLYLTCLGVPGPGEA